VSYAAFADLVGLRGINVERPEEIAAAWDIALASDRPSVIDARVDPDVPPLPPHITLKEAKAFLMATLKGDKARGGFVKQAMEHMFPSLGHKV
jgi:pyruvate dehydrogenase (quinone)